MAEITAAASNKRRRVAADGAACLPLLRCLSDLPIEPLSHVASFLAAPSQSIFAIALAGKDDHFIPNESSQKIITGSEWDTLDFGDIEKELAARLSDENIDAILRCVDSVNKLKTLRLTNLNITGVGLEPLRGSRIIEKIDLSLVGEHQSPVLKPEPPISCDAVIPILDSIIVEGSALKHLQFPRKWREKGSEESAFHQFLLRYKEMLDDRDDIRCLKCSREERVHAVELDSYNYATQKYSCIACSKQYCYECEEEDGTYSIYMCYKCERCYCSACETMYSCELCGEEYCKDCAHAEECSGDECNEFLCGDCVKHCVNCQKPYCGDCYGYGAYACQFCCADDVSALS